MDEPSKNPADVFCEIADELGLEHLLDPERVAEARRYCAEEIEACPHEWERSRYNYSLDVGPDGITRRACINCGLVQTLGPFAAEGWKDDDAASTR